MQPDYTLFRAALCSGYVVCVCVCVCVCVTERMKESPVLQADSLPSEPPGKPSGTEE